ncbi:hypothetical protein F8388_000107 [Cannabis sativa]|uniref:Uncharacterized protein n=1 Tax=Cannabis sativa TaxID=3483 RepID=A0A7J6DQ60_CANSA|nr:hypothetical protein G4B88_024828 [Cannabis sativa]KAF4360348.1 hypothetical protein G4B88_000022 [Cannabis sativa]KAF4371940.1 hypothetical protein F8388_000107 [Cannabis sativa]
MEKRIMENTARGSVLARPSQMQKAPPMVWRIQRVHSLPLIPKCRAATSDAHPPKGRAKRLAMPNEAAMIPAGEKYKPVIEIFSNDIISGQFNTHGVSVEKDKDPCPVVGDGVP